MKQAGAELGQAQPKLGLNFNQDQFNLIQPSQIQRSLVDFTIVQHGQMKSCILLNSRKVQQQPSIVRLVQLSRPILLFITSKSGLKWLRYGLNHYSQPQHFWETCWGLARQLLILYQLSKPSLLLTPSKSDLKWRRYDQNRNIIAPHGMSGRLAGGQLVS